MDDHDSTASPDSKPPEEPQHSVQSEPETPADDGAPAPDEGSDSPPGGGRD
jgi:hypothetical protein